MHHTIITFDLASYHRLNEAALQALLAGINDRIWQSGELNLDEWKTTVVQVSPKGDRTGIPGYRSE